MSGKVGYTLAGLGATYTATQIGRWTGFTGARNRMAGRRQNRRRQPYFPPRVSRPRGQGRGRPRRPQRTAIRQKKKLHQSATLSGDGSFSCFSHGYKMLPFYSKGVYKTTRKLTYMINYPTQLTATAGLQTVGTPLQIFINGHCSTMYGTISGVDSTTRVAFLSASSELYITNQDLGAVKIQL